ncbi:RHS domain-containing protein [Acidovorax sp. LjRoot117]|uniref:RHS domain-containing protein n=1 Tax=Acidovorax sp. LjRoot117 TaxID=3342255 RepID=UPI003F5088BF
MGWRSDGAKPARGRSSLFIYEPGSFVPLATAQGTQNDHHTYWYQCDQIGTPQELTYEQGGTAWAADYKVWGEARVRETTARTGTDGASARNGRHWHERQTPYLTPGAAIEQPFRFQGQQFDE